MLIMIGIRIAGLGIEGAALSKSARVGSFWKSELDEQARTLETATFYRGMQNRGLYTYTYVYIYIYIYIEREREICSTLYNYCII